MNKYFIFSIIFIVNILIFSCLNKNIVQEEDTKNYYILYDVLNEMKITENDFIKLSNNDTGIFCLPVKDEKIIDSTAEELSMIYYSKMNSLNPDQKDIFLKYFPYNTNETIYKLVFEVLKARAESDVAENNQSLIKYLTEIEKRSNIKIYNGVSDATNDVAMITDETKQFYDNYLTAKINQIIKEESPEIKKAIFFNNQQITELYKQINNFYLKPNEKNNKYLITAGALISVIAAKQDRFGEKPFLPLWNAFTNSINKLAGKEYHDNWEKNVKIKVENEGKQMLTDMYSGKVKEKYFQ